MSNEFVGKADMKGKQYLLDLTLECYPVIPTIDDLDNITVKDMSLNQRMVRIP